MKKLILLLSVAAFCVNGYSQTNPKQKSSVKRSSVKKEVTASAPEKIALNKAKPDKKTVALRKLHAQNLANSPFKKILQMSKTERKANGIPPNKYYENEWELTMNPETGRPTTENLRALREQLNLERKRAVEAGRTPGDASDNNWVERGPTNVGGRTRAIMFDPNDASYNTVFAGGVSGGLWKNTNISSAASTWTRVNIPENLNVSCIKADPNTPTTFYVGTGESYTGGDAGGDGVWKSTDSGATWTRVLGGITGNTVFQSASYVTVNSPAGIAGSYASFPTTGFGTAIPAGGITANVVEVIDNTAPTSDGCETITNAAALAGKIALIRRGTCTFVVKVKAAQVAGAIAVIMMNNAPGVPVAMGGTDATITIPSVMLSQADGNTIETALGSGTVNVTLNPSTPNMVTGNIVPGIQYINDLAIRNNGGTSEIFVACGDSYSNGAYMGSPSIGIYKSVDGGSTWSALNMPLTAAGNKHCPNNIEIGADNKIWVSTTESWSFGDGGGKVFCSTDGGTTFIDKYTVTGNGGGARVEIEASKTTADKLYVLAELNQAAPATPTIEVKLIRTTDGFATSTATALPVGNETRETTYGFTGGQAFYDLMIESDPTNDQIIYVGGIDLYRSTDGGNTWTAISNWTTDVHSDQHAMTFKPNNSNIAIFGNDGGVYYSGSLSTTGTPASPRNNGFNVTQFYSVGVAPSGATGGNLVNDYFAAGAQDNGSQYFASAGPGTNASVESQGGDGAFTMFDQGADKYYITNYVYNENINRRIIGGAVKTIDNDNGANNGTFICPMALDSSLDILYSDYTTSAGVYGIRRYTNVGLTGTVGRTTLTNALLNGQPTALTVSKYTTSSTTLLIGTRNNKLLRVTNANAPTPTWTDITGSSFVGSISDVEFGLNENQIFVTFHNYGVTNIWYSGDAGVTWQNKEGNFPDIPVKSILQNPLNTNEVIVGTELGVWYTNTFNTASPIWKQSYNGMSNVKVTDLDLRNDNTVYAATYGRGIFSGVFTSVTLSTDDVAAAKGIKVYPNPTKGQLNIAVSSYSGKLSVKVFDLNGRQVYSEDVNNFNAQSAINMGNLQKGVYVVQVSGENLDFSQKVVLD